jgi:hypothetical protein
MSKIFGTRSARSAAIVGGLLLLMALSTVGATANSGKGNPPPESPPELPPEPAPEEAASSEAASSSPTASCPQVPAFDPANFSNPTRIDNRFSPLIPGTELVLEGRANLGGGVLPHRVVFTVTDLTKMINGVRTLVVWDRDFQEDEIVEAELAFFAQDNAGNLWSMGEYPEEYEDGQFVGAPSTWIAGLSGALPGTLVPGDPRQSRDWFLQGFAPDIEFLDCAKVTKTGETTCGPLACYSNVMVVREKSPLDVGGGAQLKYYAPGIGVVQVGAASADPEGETLVLVSVRNLRRNGLGEAREEARKLERRAYEVSEVYRGTPRMER